MAATIQIHELNGAGETPTDKTSGTVRFKNADDATVDLNNPMVVPGSGFDWSYQKYLRAKWTAQGGAVQISNLVAYMDGSVSFGTGVNVFGMPLGSFSTPAQETGSTGLTDMSTYTSGSPLDMDGNNTGPFTPDSPFAADYIGDYLLMAMRVGPTASNGVTPSESLTLSYDEI